jgi:hypothetical protein
MINKSLRRKLLAALPAHSVKSGETADGEDNEDNIQNAKAQAVSTPTVNSCVI